MKSNERKGFTVARICFATAGMICIILSMKDGDASQTYLNFGLVFTNIGLFLSCRGLSLLRKKNAE